MSITQVFSAQARDAALQIARTRAINKPRVLLAGGAGTLGSAMLERLCGSGHWGDVTVLTQDSLQSTLPGLHTLSISSNGVPAQFDVGVIVLDQARNYHERERAFWMPSPAELSAAAQRMKDYKVTTLAVVVPHLQASLPQGLKAGLANLDEQAVSALGFERLLIVRPASSVHTARPQDFLPAVAHWMLSQLHYMIPDRERPVRAIKLAAFVDAALSAWLSTGTHGTRVVAPEVLWQAAATKDINSFATQWATQSLKPSLQAARID